MGSRGASAGERRLLDKSSALVNRFVPFSWSASTSNEDLSVYASPLQTLRYQSEDLVALLSSSSKTFWSTMVFNDSVGLFVKSYLVYARELSAVPEDDPSRELVAAINRRIFNIFARLADPLIDGGKERIPPDVHSKLVQRCGLVGIPTLISLANAYASPWLPNGHSCRSVIYALLNLCSFEPFQEWMRIVIPRSVQALEQTCSQVESALNEAQATEKVEQILVEASWFLADTSSSLEAWLEVYPAAAFALSQDRKWLRTVHRVYEAVLPALYFAAEALTESPETRDNVRRFSAYAQANFLRLVDKVLETALEKRVAASPPLPSADPLWTGVPPDVRRRAEDCPALTKYFLQLITDLATTSVPAIAVRFCAGDCSDPWRLVRDYNRTLKLSTRLRSALSSKRKPKGNIEELELIVHVLDSATHESHNAESADTGAAAVDVGDSSRDSETRSKTRTGGGEVDAELAKPVSAEQLSTVQELLPDLGEGFITACLNALDCNTECVIHSLLEDSLPERVASLDRSMKLSDLERLVSANTTTTASTSSSNSRSTTHTTAPTHTTSTGGSAGGESANLRMFVGKKYTAPKGELRYMNSAEERQSGTVLNLAENAAQREFYEEDAPQGEGDENDVVETAFDDVYDDEYDDTFDAFEKLNLGEGEAEVRESARSKPPAAATTASAGNQASNASGKGASSTTNTDNDAEPVAFKNVSVSSEYLGEDFNFTQVGRSQNTQHRPKPQRKAVERSGEDSGEQGERGGSGGDRGGRGRGGGRGGRGGGAPGGQRRGGYSGKHNRRDRAMKKMAKSLG